MKNILFMCVANSARSQMAEGFAKHFLSHDFTFYSAGSHPTVVNYLAIKVMQEIDIDISNYYSKTYNDLPTLFKENLSLVVTLCKEEVCPTSARNTEHFHWPFDDPAIDLNLTEEEQLAKFRKIRDKIKEKILSIQS